MITFFIITCIAIILMVILSEVEEESLIFWPFVILVVYGACLWFFVKDIALPVYQWIIENPGHLLLYFVFYAILGMVWSTFKWFNIVFKAKAKFNIWLKSRKEWYHEQISTYEKDDKLKIKLEAKYNIEVQEELQYYKPEVKDKKGDITAWMIFWPFSCLRYVIGSAIIDFFTYITNKLTGFYSNITNRIFTVNDKDL